MAARLMIILCFKMVILWWPSLESVSSGDYSSAEEAVKNGIITANLSINQSAELQGFEEASRERLTIVQ